MDFHFGFYAQGVTGKRVPCRVVEYWKHALTAPGDVTDKTDYYLSAFTFGEDFVDHLKATGSTSNFTGRVGADVLWFDVDRSDLNEALADTRRLVEYLVCGVPSPVPESFGDANEQFDFRVPPLVSDDGIQIFFSGSKGFHVGVPLTDVPPTPDFPKLARAAAVAVADGAGVKIDTAIYERSRLFRCPNTRHAKTGLYKIPFTYLELTTFYTLEKILETAKVPRSVEPVPDVYRVPWEKLAGLASAFTPLPLSRKDGDASGLKPDANDANRLRRATRDFIQHGAERGERNNRLFQAVCDCVHCGWSRRAVDSLFIDVARQTGLTLNETTTTIASAFEKVRCENGL